MTEQWLPIPNYEGYYEVSDQGRVRSLQRIVPMSDGRQYHVTGKILTSFDDGRGYLAVNLYKHGSARLSRIHSIVLEAFIGQCPTGMGACHHPDPDPTNNHLSNLRWDTRKANEEDKIKQGRKHGPQGSDNSQLTENDIRKIRKDKRIRKEIAKDYNVSRECINHIMWRNTWKHVK